MRSYSIEVSSFFQKGLRPLSEAEGMILIFSGKQGSGKTFAAVKFAHERGGGRPIVSNFHMAGATYATFSEILVRDTSHSIVIIDEIFTQFTKNDRVDKSFTSWLAQSRKNDRIVIIIAQEFLEIPLVLRRFGRYLIGCSKRFGLVFESWSDGNTLHYDESISEYVADPYKLRVYKRTKKIGDLYDTLERIA